MIKKLIAVLLLCICCSLFAEEKPVTYLPGDYISFSLENAKDVETYIITSILPFGNGYVIKMYKIGTRGNEREYYLEFYLEEGSCFYTEYGKRKVTKLQPNYMTSKKES